MNKSFAEYLSLYFNDYLVLQRNYSINTINSYKYTFKLLLSYIVNNKNIKINDIDFDVITKDIVKEFLNYIENEKNCSVTTRNQRLASIKSFYQYVGIEEPEYFQTIQGILSIHVKKCSSKNMDYLTVDELKEFFDSIDTSNEKGRRNLVLLSLMYDSATRVSEIINLKVGDLRLDESPCITVLGKGRKERSIPIMNNTKELLIKYIEEKGLLNSNYLFINSKGDKLCARTIQIVIQKNNKTNKRISPHSLRRSRAVHLLEAGVDLTYIRDLFGHASVTTTEEYAKASSEYKRKMLSKVNQSVYSTNVTSWNKDPNILEDILNF